MPFFKILGDTIFCKVSPFFPIFWTTFWAHTHRYWMGFSRERTGWRLASFLLGWYLEVLATGWPGKLREKTDTLPLLQDNSIWEQRVWRGLLGSSSNLASDPLHDHSDGPRLCSTLWWQVVLWNPASRLWWYWKEYICIPLPLLLASDDTEKNKFASIGNTFSASTHSCLPDGVSYQTWTLRARSCVGWGTPGTYKNHQIPFGQDLDQARPCWTGIQVFTVERLCSCQPEAVQRQTVLPSGRLIKNAELAKLTITTSGGGLSADFRAKERGFSKAQHQCPGTDLNLMTWSTRTSAGSAD